MIRLGGAAIALIAAATRLARADTPVTSPITNRNFGVEVYDNVPLGNSQTVAMGGAAVANASGSSGTLINVSAPAVRPTTDLDWWSLDVHFDYLTSSLSTDAENSGLPSSQDGGTNVVTAGIALRVRNWAVALTETVESTKVQGPVDPNTGKPIPLYGDLERTQLAIAGWIPRRDLAIGAALDVGAFSLDTDGLFSPQLFAITAIGGEIGATWIPTARSLRLGVNAQTGLRGGTVTSSTCNPNACDGYMLPDQIVAPWQVAVGAAYRFGPTPWNILYPATFRDERAVTVVADLVIVGSIANANGLDAWGLMELQRMSEHPAVSPRAGAEFEWLPGRLRVRAGTYWEPGLLDGASGRPHVTFGTQVMLFPFHAWGLRRTQLTLTGDLAPRYNNASLSIGFWH